MKQLLIAVKATIVLDGADRLDLSAAGHRIGQSSLPASGRRQPDRGQWQDGRLRTDRAEIHQARILSRTAFRGGHDGYDGLSSGGSNHGPTNQKLIDRVRGDVAKFRAENPTFTGPIPADIVTGFRQRARSAHLTRRGRSPGGSRGKRAPYVARIRAQPDRHEHRRPPIGRAGRTPRQCLAAKPGARPC